MDDSEILEQALNDAMDNIEDQVTVFSSEIKTEGTGEPENAEEIAAPIDEMLFRLICEMQSRRSRE